MTFSWDKVSFTELEFREVWETSASIAECVRKLNLPVYTTAYKQLKSVAAVLGLTQEHFTGSNWRTGLSTPAGEGMRKPIETYLVKGRRVNSHHLKSRLIQEGFLEEECAAPYCPATNPTVNPFTGESKALKFALDHINGDNLDNRLENLRLLCYHCHGETDTYAGANAKIGRVDPGRQKNLPASKKAFKQEVKPYKAKKPHLQNRMTLTCGCGNPMSIKATQCSQCYKRVIKITATPEEIVLALQLGTSYEALGKQYGATGNAIKKFLKRAGIVPPKSAYARHDSNR